MEDLRLPELSGAPLSFNPEFLSSVGPGNVPSTTRDPTLTDSDDASTSEDISEDVSDSGSEYNTSGDEDMSLYQSYLKDENATQAASNTRMSGGRPAVVRRIGTELDSDDEIIREMKGQGYKDPQIKERLVSEGRTNYATKSITTRYNRIIKIYHAQETENLDCELTDWHIGDDEILDQARAKYTKMLADDIARAEDRYWRMVADSVHDQQKAHGQPKIRFSKHACRARQERREDGTAEPLYELDSDPERRTAEREARLAEIHVAKIAQQENREKKAVAARAKQVEHMTKAEQAQLERLSKREARQLRIDAVRRSRQEREDKRRSAAAARAIRKAKRAARAKERAHRARTVHERAATKKRAVEARRTASQLDEVERKKQVALAQLEAERKLVEKRYEAAKSARELTSLVRLRMSEALDRNEHEQGIPILARARVNADNLKGDRKSLVARLTGRTRSVSVASRARAPSVAGHSAVSVSAASPGAEKTFLTMPSHNPRWDMQLEELREVCSMRGVEVPGGADRRQLVQALMTADMTTTVMGLRELLKQRGMPIYGHKSVLILRLANDDAGNLARGTTMNDTIKARVEKRRRGVSPSAASDDGGHVAKKARCDETKVVDTVEGEDDDAAENVNHSNEGSREGEIKEPAVDGQEQSG